MLLLPYQGCEQTSRLTPSYYRPQTKFAKVMFLQVSVCPQGGWLTWQGACMAGGVCMAGVPVWQVGHVWQEGVHGRGSMHGRGRVWQGGHV